MTSLTAQLAWLADHRASLDALGATAWAGAEADLRQLLGDLRGEGCRGLAAAIESQFGELFGLVDEVRHTQQEGEGSRPRADGGEIAALPTETATKLRTAIPELGAVVSDRQTALGQLAQFGARLWELTLKWLRSIVTLSRFLRSRRCPPGAAVGRLRRAALAELDAQAGRLRELLRYVLVAAPDWPLAVPDDLAADLWTLRVSGRAWLRAMWNLFWSAVRHPFSATTIDLSTGRVLYRT